MNYVNRKYKDTLFRALFSERKHLLSLYNAVNETNYTNEEDLEINTLENVIYLKMKNDISFLFGFSLNLYEHQSSVNPNMPLRDLFYVADLLQKIVKDKNLYSSSLVGIPTPKFVMFYNGTDEEAAQMEIAEAVNRAVDECIAEGVLGDFLSEHRAEAVAMSIYEYDEEKHMKAEREEHYALGLQDGVQKGRYEAFLEMGLSEEEARRRAEAVAMSIYEYDEEKHMKAEREEHYALGFQQGYYEAFLEMGLSEEEARHRAEMAVTDADVYDEEKRRKTEEQKRYESGLQDGMREGLQKGKTQERENGLELLREAYREMGLSEEEAERKAAEKYREQPDTKYRRTK